MKWSNLNYIKTHSRICNDCEDALLEQYANAAEEFILDYCNRTYENVIDVYGEVPARFYEAVQLLVDTMYTYRSPLTVQHLSAVDYTFDPLVSNFVRYTKETPLQNERDTLLAMLHAEMTDLDFEYNELETPTDEQWAAYQAELAIISSTYAKYQNIENPTSKICQRLRNELATIKADVEGIFDE